MGGATGGIAIGLRIGWFATWIRRHLSDSLLEITAFLLIPVAAWILAEFSGTSDVLAVVTAGMYIGQTLHTHLPPTYRLRIFYFWEVLTFILEDLLFILIGFQIPILLTATSTISIPQILEYTTIVSLATIVVRIVWTFGTAYLLGVLSHRQRQYPLPRDGR
jgi:CPA1 family monovalent cation:H+ antiporter